MARHASAKAAAAGRGKQDRWASRQGGGAVEQPRSAVQAGASEHPQGRSLACMCSGQALLPGRACKLLTAD